MIYNVRLMLKSIATGVMTQYTMNLYDEDQFYRIYLDGELVSVDNMDSNMGAYYIHITGSGDEDDYVFHREDGPAFMNSSGSSFFLNGECVGVEDLPISDEDKVYMILRYGSCSESIWGKLYECNYGT